MMRWSRLLGVSGVSMVLSACGVLGGAPATAPPSPAPTSAPATTVPPTVARAPASPVPSAVPKPTTTPEPAAAAAADTVWVGNTDGEGVYVRNTPVMADRAKPYPDGTPLTIVGDDVDGDGQHWKHIKTPDGLEGYVPSTYTVESPP